jgi:hypothetical protein
MDGAGVQILKYLVRGLVVFTRIINGWRWSADQ